MRGRVLTLTALSLLAIASACGSFSGSGGGTAGASDAGSSSDAATSDGANPEDGAATVGDGSADDTDAATIEDAGGAPAPNPYCTDGGTAAGILFSTSTAYAPGKDFASVADGDTLCKGLADNTGLVGRHWKAWLSDETTGAFAHIAPAAMASYARPDCLPVAPLAAFESTTVNLTNPPEVNERGITVKMRGVWTGTNAAGMADKTQTCKSWSSSSAGDVGLLGGCSETGKGWTNYNNGTTSPCSAKYLLYCFEQTN